MRIALAQINPTVGDLRGNAAKILAFTAQAKAAQACVVTFPELALTGYPPEDLLLKESFINDNRSALHSIAAQIDGITAIVGFVDCEDDKLYNAAAIISGGKVQQVYRKILLPNYGVFDENRYFSAGIQPIVLPLGGASAGIAICEDIWYDHGPVKAEHAGGAKIIFVLNASPYHMTKVNEREALLRRQAKEYGLYMVYTNAVGGQDELVFDGYSMVVGPDGNTLARACCFGEQLLTADLPLGQQQPAPSAPTVCAVAAADEEVYRALQTGLGDYVRKNGFQEAVIGLSGGIDSSLVAALAVDALGKENVHGIFMPTRYSSNESREDAELLARNLGIGLKAIPIDDLFAHYLNVLAPHFGGQAPDITEENLQARIRGNIIMAFSNKFNWIVLTTGNKSEMSTGYATLYGDMAGGLAVIKDVPKVLVYRLCAYRNALGAAIPQRVMVKAPTAELRFDQKDSDSLPPYETLDPILKHYVEDDRGMTYIVNQGFPEETVRRVMNLVDKSEYKRRQSPPGIKITARAFGKDRRMPITNRFSEYARFDATGKESACWNKTHRTTSDIAKE